MNEPSFWGTKEEILAETLHWTWSVQIQINRFWKSLQNELNSGKVAKLDIMKMCSITSYDEHMILVAARNLIRAVKMIEKVAPSITIDQDLRDDLKELRDIYEHWDETRNCLRQKDYSVSRSAREFISR